MTVDGISKERKLGVSKGAHSSRSVKQYQITTRWVLNKTRFGIKNWKVEVVNELGYLVLHPLDLECVVFMCADDFLRQLIHETCVRPRTKRRRLLRSDGSNCTKLASFGRFCEKSSSVCSREKQQDVIHCQTKDKEKRIAQIRWSKLYKACILWAILWKVIFSVQQRKTTRHDSLVLLVEIANLGNEYQSRNTYSAPWNGKESWYDGHVTLEQLRVLVERGSITMIQTLKRTKETWKIPVSSRACSWDDAAGAAARRKPAPNKQDRQTEVSLQFFLHCVLF